MPLRSGRTSLLVVSAALGLPGVSAMSDVTVQKTTTLVSLPPKDARATTALQHLDLPRTFPTFATKADWDAHRARLRQHILVCCGLYPMPLKTPLRTKISDRVERDGYTIEKVSFQTYPGFYLAGNLYRPLPKVGAEKASTKHPGVLIAHGHWANGRMANQAEGSIPARAITFARQGYVAFTYDMVGYNDTRQIDHRFANTPRHELWGISLMGLQTWNSIRALDFISTLRDVDPKRLAITGESGGGTQTMLLGAIDDRLAAVGPCVMVSHSMQGGCLCENVAGLRIAYSNMEIAAAAAPKPQIMVGASGDWTATTMTIEGPAVASIYGLHKQPDHLKYVLFNFGHNINQTSREAVYGFFGKYLNGASDTRSLKEPSYTMEPVESLRVFPQNMPLPQDAKDANTLTNYLITQAQTSVEQHKLREPEDLAAFQKTFRPAWEHVLDVEMPKKDALTVVEQVGEQAQGGKLTRLNIGRKGHGDNIPAALFLPNSASACPVVVLIHPGGRAALMDMTTGKPGPLVSALLLHKRGVLLLDTFLTGERADAAVSGVRQKPPYNYFTTYNRTDAQERVQDILTACAALRARKEVQSILLAGLERGGLLALLAAPAADGVAADCSRLDLTTDDALLANDIFVPGLRRLGDFRTVALLAAPHPLLLHNTGANFPAANWLTEAYTVLKKETALRTDTDRLSDAALVTWLCSH